MATEQYDGYSPELADDWAGHEVSPLQHDATSNPSIAHPASDDLAYKPITRSSSSNNPPPNGWLYPHKKGIGTGSNLEPFKAEIEARTQRGENCKAIATALNAMGVQTSDRAVSRAQRKVKKPPPDGVRLSAKSKVQALRKAELIRMTQEGMSPDEIYQDLTSRGMELKKGVATVLRLQSAWGVARNEKRWLGNFRHQCHKKARAQQADAFTDIAKELGVQEIKGWVQGKMQEDAARQARHELALKLMGEHAPINPERRKLQKPRRENDPSEGQSHTNDDEDDLDSGSSEDEHGSGSPFSGAVTNLRFALANPACQDDNVPRDGLLQSPHKDVIGAQSAGYVPAPLGEPSNAGGGGIESSPYHEYPPLHDQADDSVCDSGGEQQDSASTSSHMTPGMVDLIPEAASALPMPTHPPRSMNEMPTSFPHPNSLDANVSPQPAGTSSTRTASQSTTSVLPGHGEGYKAQSKESTAPAPAPAPKPAASVTPALVLAPEETEANKSTLSALDQYNDAARAYKELLEARNNNQPLPGSLTGMPPSAKEVETAKRKLKDATQAMMLALD
ncbi:hypothetical protein DHEL01_v205202 [Diaporthe helianthi]|uniref:Uncharacterized protein n=1 Tax=Diaporthe helianthi TaxID=158607 RepID=A0A2P5I1Q3_DIAHE|nr:hypothetical protein DHEL01_v205202 [Diaporthe helianthi]